MPVTALRTVVWSTGGVGSNAIDAIRRRPDLELVGVWVHSPDKDGKDVGELTDADQMGLAGTPRARPLAVVRRLRGQRPGPRRGGGAGLCASAGGGHQRRVDVIHRSGVPACLLL